MEPYQKAAEAIRSRQEKPVNVLKSLGMTALGGAFAGATSRLIPAIGSLINEYVPDELSMKGLTKLDPRFNNFIKGAMDSGYSYEDVRNFLGEKVNKAQEAQPSKKNIIEQVSPDLHQFILDEINQGRSPLEAGALASLGQKGKNFKSVIDKIVKQHKTPWASILQTTYGETKSPKKQSMQEPSVSQPSDKWSEITKTLQNLLNS